MGYCVFNIFYDVVNVTIEFHPNYPSITIYIATIQWVNPFLTEFLPPTLHSLVWIDNHWVSNLG